MSKHVICPSFNQMMVVIVTLMMVIAVIVEGFEVLDINLLEINIQLFSPTLQADAALYRQFYLLGINFLVLSNLNCQPFVSCAFKVTSKTLPRHVCSL